MDASLDESEWYIYLDVSLKCHLNSSKGIFAVKAVFTHASMLALYFKVKKIIAWIYTSWLKLSKAKNNCITGFYSFVYVILNA